MVLEGCLALPMRPMFTHTHTHTHEHTNTHTHTNTQTNTHTHCPLLPTSLCQLQARRRAFSGTGLTLVHPRPHTTQPQHPMPRLRCRAPHQPQASGRWVARGAPALAAGAAEGSAARSRQWLATCCRWVRVHACACTFGCLRVCEHAFVWQEWVGRGEVASVHQSLIMGQGGTRQDPPHQSSHVSHRVSLATSLSPAGV